MNNQQIKFRMWCREAKKFFYEPEQVLECLKQQQMGVYPHEELTFQQFTGLLDKNGKEIYEGDILRSEEDLEKDCMRDDVTTYIKYSTVTFANGYFTQDEENPFFLCINPNWFEVVGNILENPELLTP
jgi:uncharacterized phage protein (TIGR01671 family)